VNHVKGTPAADDTDQIVFVTEDGVPTGLTAPKLASHHERTRLHLAFSCYIFRRSDDALLITRRALDKKVWPGVWTNSVCGHPMPGEVLEDAVRRRAEYELGLPVLIDIKCVVPRYVYRTPAFNGIVEHEFCPILTAAADDDPVPNPLEVDSFQWRSWSDYARLLREDEQQMSYWAKDQYPLLEGLEPFVSLSRSTPASDERRPASST
jgi:isopentenyl-diphosphate delta-isomerase